MARNQLYFDEYEDVLASTDLLAIVAPGLPKQPSNWKWMILAAHNGLQGALVCAIQDTSVTNILNKESATQMLNYLETLEGAIPQERLADFSTLLKRYRKKYTFPGVTIEQLKQIRKLHNKFRNNFAHFIEPHAGKQPIQRGAAYDKRHAGGDCLILSTPIVSTYFEYRPSSTDMRTGNQPSRCQR